MFNSHTFHSGKSPYRPFRCTLLKHTFVRTDSFVGETNIDRIRQFAFATESIWNVPKSEIWIEPNFHKRFRYIGNSITLIVHLKRKHGIVHHLF